jgi:hypothetical protein
MNPVSFSLNTADRQKQKPMFYLCLHLIHNQWLMIPQELCCTLWFSPAILSLKELLVHNQLSLIIKTPLRGLDDSQRPVHEVPRPGHQTVSYAPLAAPFSVFAPNFVESPNLFSLLVYIELYAAKINDK